jgi:DNA-binding NarL/FixJ family response regulator
MLRSVVACDAFVGRREELAFLQEEFAAAREGRARFVPIEGEAGIGKSRIAREFLAAVAAQATITTGQCGEHVRTPYHPIATILRAIDPQDALAVLKPRERGGGQKKAALFESTLRTLTRESRHRPIVATIEDVQWADSATVELLRYLIANLQDARIMIVLIMRTESIAENGALAALRLNLSRNRANAVRLHGLRRNDIRHLVQQIASENDRQIAPDVISQIEILSEGNPLFVEELVRIALDNGSLNLSANVPLSIQAMLAERFAPFSEPERAMLIRAAIVGQHFDAGFLAKIVRRPLDEVFAVMQRATDAGIVVASQTVSGAFAFRHALIRQALDDQLILGLAAPLHVRIAEELGQLPDAADRIAELAFHWSAARVPDRARYYNERAAEAAAGIYAYRDAIGFYSTALGWDYPPGSARARIFERLGTLLYVDGCGQEPALWFERARQEYEALGDVDGVAHALLLQADQYWVDARTTDSLNAATRAVETLGDRGQPRLLAEAYLSLARFSVTLGDPQSARAHLLRAERLESYFDVGQRASFHEVRAEMFAALGDADRALADCRAASELAKRTGISELIAQVENNYAVVACDLGEIALAVERHKIALAEAHRTSMMWRVAYSALNYAATLVVGGDLRTARSLLWTALETGVTTATFKTKVASVGIPLALLLDDRQLLRACADEEALEHAERSGEIQRIGSVRAAFAALRAAQGDAVAAASLLGGTLDRLARVHRCWNLVVEAALHDPIDGAARAAALLARSTARARVLRAYRLLVGAIAGRDGDRRIVRMAGLAARAFAASGCRQYETLALKIAARPAKARPEIPLSARQLEVARLVADGQTNKSIALRLSISENTVERHLSDIFARLGLRSRSRLAARIVELTYDGGNPGYRP